MAFDNSDVPAPSSMPPSSARLFDIELQFERAVCADRRLALFRRNSATWEMLLLLAVSGQRAGLGLYEAVGQVQSTALGQSAMLKFLRDRRDDGLLLMSRQAGQRNKCELILDSELLGRLCGLLDQRRRALACRADPGLQGAG